MKLIPIIADSWRMDGGVAFGVIPKSLWQRYYPVDENNTIPIVSRCLLIDDGERRILIDTGMGRKQDKRYYSFKYLSEEFDLVSSLASAGYEPSDITDVLFTHLHDDHVGGAVYRDADGRLMLQFPCARHWVSSAQWKWALNPNKREGASYLPENLQPLKDIIILIDEPGDFTDEIRLAFHSGHTMGQIVPTIQKNDATIVYCGDFIPSAAHIHVPFIASVDIQPLLAMEEKEVFLEMAQELGYVLFFEHDAVNEAGRVELTEKGYRLADPLVIGDR